MATVAEMLLNINLNCVLILQIIVVQTLYEEKNGHVERYQIQSTLYEELDSCQEYQGELTWEQGPIRALVSITENPYLHLISAGDAQRTNFGLLAAIS